jgi:hypothetical protein
MNRAPANRGASLSIQLTAAEFNPQSPATVQDLIAGARRIPYPADWDSHNPN